MQRYGPTPPIRIFCSTVIDMLKYYKITRIEGEYAYLQDETSPETEELFLALALLPFGCDVGTRLKWENFCYEIIG